uniref:Uncharacterized protein n=1 Tax=Anguilla anguilla TaxID=7936 RepID=A0A0E9VLI9_ANGAN
MNYTTMVTLRSSVFYAVLCVLSTNKTRTQSLLFLFSLVAKALNI